jgi:hypothetical protein
MPRGLPDSWVLWGAKKAARAARKARQRAARGSQSSGTILQTVGTKFHYKFRGVKIYDGALRSYLHTNSGDLWKWLEVRGDLAVAAAKAQVGVKTGRLRDSIHKKHLGNATGQYLWIGSHLPYAYKHHEGTSPHTITPSASRAGRPLVFRKGTVLIHTAIVEHPGTKPNPYLRDQLRYFLY